MTPGATRPDAVVFLGPTLARSDAERLLPGADIRGPAERGDVLRAALATPRAICLIDGYFDQRLAVHHKEILWALKQGIVVCGAASMGALRAAELDVYGMRGIGDIYQAFAARELENDDEVALIHGPAPEYRTMSEPLVDIRSTLARAVAATIIDASSARTLVELAAQRFYPDRSYARLLKDATSVGIDSLTCARLEGWLSDPLNRYSQKRADAELALDDVCRALGTEAVTRPNATWEFPWSSAWAVLWNQITAERRAE